MTTVIVLSPAPYRRLSPTIQRWINYLSDGHDAHFCGPAADGSGREMGYTERLVSANRPLQTQGSRLWLSSDRNPIYLVVAESCETLAISHNIPTIWIHEGEIELPEQAVALAARAACVVSSAKVAHQMGIDIDRHFDIDDASSTGGPHVEAGLNVRSRPSGLHRTLVAELFGRHETAASEALDITGIPTHLSDHLLARTQHRLAGNAPLVRERFTVAPPNYQSPRFLAVMDDVQKFNAENLVGALIVTQASSSAPATQHAAIRLALAGLGPATDHTTQTIVTLAAKTGASEAIGLQLVIELLANPSISDDFFHAIASHSNNTACVGAASVALWRRDPLDPDLGKRLVEIADKLDSWSRYPGLVKTAFDYWHKLAPSTTISTTATYEAPAPSFVLEGADDFSLSDLQESATKALVDSDFHRACQLFDEVRRRCSSPSLATTGTAARLNLGWALAQSGEARAIWEPYIASVFVSAGPRSADLLLLRLLVEQCRNLQRSYPLVDRSARYPSLWETGLSYWRNLTDSEWDSQQASSAPACALATDSDLQESIESLQSRASAALLAEDFERAAELFDAVRALSLDENAPRPTTELAARLNAGWALATGGADDVVWKPYISSALAACGPATTGLTDEAVQQRQLIVEAAHGLILSGATS